MGRREEAGGREAFLFLLALNKWLSRGGRDALILIKLLFAI